MPNVLRSNTGANRVSPWSPPVPRHHTESVGACAETECPLCRFSLPPWVCFLEISASRLGHTTITNSSKSRWPLNLFLAHMACPYSAGGLSTLLIPEPRVTDQPPSQKLSIATGSPPEMTDVASHTSLPMARRMTPLHLRGQKGVIPPQPGGQSMGKNTENGINEDLRPLLGVSVRQLWPPELRWG